MSGGSPERFKESGINSFRLALEMFNRSYEKGRTDSVLILLDHSFEMVLKGAILKKGGQIREEGGDGNTISTEKCINKCDQRLVLIDRRVG